MRHTPPKRVLIGLLAVICLLVAACGNDDSAPASPTAEPEPTQSSPTTEPEPTQSSPTTEPTPTAEPGPSEPTPTTEPEPTQSSPTTEPEPSEPTPTVSAGTTIEVELSGGKPVDGVQRHRVDVREIVTILVAGDTTDELHIHGYDLVVPFSPSQPGTITFEANIPGIFEVETHHHGDLVIELQVG